MTQELFSVSVVSLPLNFTILLHPESISSLGIEENGYALVKGVNGLISVVKVIKDQSCPLKVTRITHSVQMTLGTSPGDSIPILPFSGREPCDAIQIAPLFDKSIITNEDQDFTQTVKRYFQSDSRPISIDSIFTLLIDSEERAFKILKCSPTDRSFSNKSTKLYFTSEPGPLLPKPSITKHLNNLVLDKSLISFVKNSIYYPSNRQYVLQSLNLPTSSGILVEGSCGSGKTSFLSAISNAVSVPTIYCSSKRLKKLSVSDYVEKLNQVFGYTSEKPQCVIMFDDIDSIVGSFSDAKLTADRIKLSTFVNLFDAVMNRSGVTVVATCTSTSGIDASLLRCGRFGQRVSLGSPTVDQQKELVRLFTGGMKIEDEDLDAIVRKIAERRNEEVCPKEIERVCRVAVASLIEEATGNQGGAEGVDDALAAYTLGQKMKAMHFGVRKAAKRAKEEDDDDQNEEEEERHRRRRHHRRHHRRRSERGGDDDDGHRRRRHRRRHHRYEEEDDDDQNEEEDDVRHRRRRRHQTERRRSARRRFGEDEDDDDVVVSNRRNEAIAKRKNIRAQKSMDFFNKPGRLDDDDDEEEEEAPPRKNKRGRRETEEEDDEVSFNKARNFPSRKPKTRNARNANNEDESDDDNGREDPFAKGAKRKGSTQKRSNNYNNDDSESDGGRKRGSRSSRRSQKRRVDDDEDDEEFRSSRRRRRKRSYFDDENEEEEVRERRPRSKRSQRY